MFSKIENYDYGYNVIAEMDGKSSNMLMDVYLYKFKANEQLILHDTDKETAVLMLDGKIKLTWEEQQAELERNSIFDEDPSCLHVAKEVTVKIEFFSEGEILIQKTTNDKKFDSKLYKQDDCRSDIFGENVLGDTSRRIVRTIFDYSNAPYSNLVIGEVINFPGKWSGYIPHTHPQPEIYFYKFDKPQGFGCSIIGDDVFKTVHNSMSAIPGDLVHPQTSAPGYAKYYCWMIRHLDNNPWVARVDDEQHTWMLKEDAKIWPEK